MDGLSDRLRSLGAVVASLSNAVKGGFILPADRAEIRALAAAGWPGA